MSNPVRPRKKSTSGGFIGSLILAPVYEFLGFVGFIGAAVVLLIALVAVLALLSPVFKLIAPPTVDASTGDCLNAAAEDGKADRDVKVVDCDSAAAAFTVVGLFSAKPPSAGESNQGGRACEQFFPPGEGVPIFVRTPNAGWKLLCLEPKA